MGEKEKTMTERDEQQRRESRARRWVQYQRRNYNMQSLQAQGHEEKPWSSVISQGDSGDSDDSVWLVSFFLSVR